MKKLLFISYVFVLLIFVIFSYVFIDANFFYLRILFTGKNFSEGPLVSVMFLLFIIIFFTYYLAVLILYNHRKITSKEIYILIGITVGILVFTYPAMLSFDIFNYIATAKVLFHYHENPYLIMPNAFLHDPILSFMHASNKTALYGPIWILLTGIPFVLSFNFLCMLFSFKLFVILFYFGTLYLLYHSNNKRVFPVLFFGLNPLVILETVVSGHNDMVMIFLAILSFLLLKQKKLLLASIFLVLSIGIKFSTVFLLPIFLYVFYLQFRNKTIDWEKVYFFAGIAMLIVFFFGIFREEIYPWYAIWFMVFFILTKRVFLFYFIVIFSFSLLLRYLPYMFSGTYFGLTPIITCVITFGMPLVFFFIWQLTKKMHVIKL